MADDSLFVECEMESVCGFMDNRPGQKKSITAIFDTFISGVSVAYGMFVWHNLYMVSIL